MPKKYESLTVTLPPMVKEFVHTYAKQNNRTMSDVVEESIQMFRFAVMSNKADFANSKAVMRGNEIVLDLRSKNSSLTKKEKELIKMDEERKKKYYDETKHLDNITGMIKNAKPERPTTEQQPNEGTIKRSSSKKTKQD
jgi:hypothetical protein